MFFRKKDAINSKNHAIMQVVLGLIALTSTFLLTLEKFKVLANSDYIASCDINLLISCGTVMKSAQAAVFGFPNQLIGLIGFSIVITIGVASLAGAKFKDWFWRGYLAGMIFAISFVHWLFYQAVFKIGALCPHCMIVWACTMPLFYYGLVSALQNKQLTIKSKKVTQKIAEFLHRYRLLILLVWYALIVGTIIVRFWGFFETIFWF